jgi:hypothetical protein
MSTRILLYLLSILLFKAEYLASEAEASRSTALTFLNTQRIFFAYAHDFNDFAKGDEYEPSSDLSQAALTVGDYAGSASSLLEIYESLSCPADKQVVRELIARDFAYYSKQTDKELSVANLGITYTKKPGVAAEAIRLRDDMRALQNLFDSTKLQFRPSTVN